VPIQAKWREYQDLERVNAQLEGSDLIHVERPIILHEEVTDGRFCDCGCGSRTARAKGGEQAHVSLLLHRYRGTRRLRHLVPERHWSDFDDLAASSERLYAPVRAYPEQLEAILDRQHKVVSVFGGQRGGKSTVLAHRVVDTWCLYGGPGRHIWWVSPKREKTRIAIRKLVTGELSEPIFPRELVRSWPSTHRADDQSIKLVEGSVIDLKFGDSDDLVGDPAIEVLVDELCRIKDKIVLDTIIGRLADFGGQMISASTPVEGHWSEEAIYQQSKTYAYYQRNPEKDDASKWVTTQLDGLKNPWVSSAEVARSIAGKENDPDILREWFGGWVGSGPRVWRHFRDKPDPATKVCHLRSGPWRDAEGWGLVNITAAVASNFFQSTHCDLRYVAGLDVNLYPSHMVICQVCVPDIPGIDPTDPKNQIMFAIDEVVKNGTSMEVARFVANAAGKIRRDPDLYNHVPIACDATAAQAQSQKSRTGGMSHAWSFNEAGHDCRPCNLSDNGKPMNPPRFDVTSLLHMLMEDTIDLPSGQSIPRLLVHAERCPRLVHSLRSQEADKNGLPKKIAGKVSDKMCGPTEALGYLSWALFSHVYTPRAEVLSW